MFTLKVGFLIVAFALTWSDRVLADCDSLGHIDETCSLQIQFFGNRDRKPNTNQAEYEKTCGINENALKCLDEYANKCLDAQPAMFTKTVLGSLTDHFKKRCKDPKSGAEFMEHNKCFEDPAVFEQFHQTQDRWYHRMQQLQKQNIDLDNGIKSSCCIFHDFQKGIRDLNVKACHDKNAMYWDEVLGDISGEAIEIFCNGLNTPEECAKNFPADMWSQIDAPVAAMDADALKERSGKFKSIIFTLLDMVSQYKMKS